MEHMDPKSEELISLFGTLTPDEAAQVLQFIENLKKERQSASQ